jgi:hypothetical protein
MDPITKAIVLGIIQTAFSVWAQRTGRPQGWIPSDKDWDELGELPTIQQIKARATLKAEAQEG